jgi:hypothetical protein
MKNSKMNFEEILNRNYFIKRPKILTVENVKNISNMSSEHRKEQISTFCSEEELHELMNKDDSLDSTLLIEFALEDFNMSVDKLSDITRINVIILKKIINGKLMPWKLKVEEVAKIIQTLNISVEEYIKGLKNKTIVIDSKDISIEGIQLPRAKNMTRKEQKRAMIEMEKQIMIQDEAEERDMFIQTLKNFVNR